MRKAVNDNPIVQVAVLGVLALVVGFMLLTRMSSKGSEPSTDTSASAASVAPDTATTPVAPTDPSGTATSTTAAPSSAAPSTAPVAQAAVAGEFVAGPGLPVSVVRAYADNKVVVLLVVRRNGIDDQAVRAAVEQEGGAADVALFVTHAGHISRYSRIAAGVDLDRVPALIVLRPRKLTQGTPVATVSYGFRGPDSAAQAIQDALYKGPTNLPYYPK